MIPKVIHYCWFGGKEIPPKVRNYISTWKKRCPEYEIKEWNESNFNVNCCSYVKEAYQNKKWAFVSDYVRLFVLVKYGGIYLDTDVEVLKSFDNLLNLDAFCGFEDSTKLSTAILGCKPGFEIFSDWLHKYDTKHFIKKDGSMDLEPNVFLFTQLCIDQGLVLNNKRQEVNGLEVFPNDWFSPKNYMTNMINRTENTITIHHFSAAWQSPLEKKMHEREAFFINNYGPKNGKRMAKLFNLDLLIKKRGLFVELKHIVKKYVLH